MKVNKIPRSEFEVMKIIWDNESSISSKDVTKIMEEKKSWRKTTTLTLLSRLMNKNYLSTNKLKKITYYTAIVTEKYYLWLETSDFFERIHKNSLKSFITTLHENNDIGDNDLDELENWIKNR